MKDLELIFLDLEEDTMLSRLFKRLSKKDVADTCCFIRGNSHLGCEEFEIEINRLFLDKEKPERWLEITELLSCANSKMWKQKKDEENL